MDKRIGFAGGEIEVTNTELDLMPNANRGGIHALGEALANGEDLILTGVNAIITPGVQVSVAEGYVVLNGEVLKVDAGVVPRTAGADLYRFVKVVTSDQADYERNYRDGSTHNVAEIIRAVPENVAAIGGGDLSVQGQTLTDVLQEDIRIQADWAQGDDQQPDYIQNKPIIQDVRNVGRVDPIQYGADSGPYNVAGDITAFAFTSQNSTTIIYTVTMANAMSNTDYIVRAFFRSDSGDLRVATDTGLWVYRPISTTQFTFVITERFAGNDQDITVFFEVVDFVP